MNFFMNPYGFPIGSQMYNSYIDMQKYYGTPPTYNANSFNLNRVSNFHPFQ